ncbi:MAG TPA: hypothetical protein GXZ75_07785 [Clostridia bacterium]|nr:hypothetical protein [Clostridia bacterium]
MKKHLMMILMLLLSISLLGCMSQGNQAGLNPGEGERQEEERTDESNEAAVADLVEAFGTKLQTVSLLAPEDVLEKSMQENYAEFVSPALLEKWLKDPLHAPGRMTSSPWPERIDIQNIEKLSEAAYKVQGAIIEVTSAEEGIGAKRSITLTVEKAEEHWLITDVNMGDYAESGTAIVYKNTQYGFSFSLPESWQGYSIVNDKWEGLGLGAGEEGKVIETGSIISIRHPAWTAEEPRQDIPIMIFTQDQWKSLQEEKFHIGAAPMGPKQLAQNNQYVFALPARYNYAFPTGYEEVEEILESNPLQAEEL